MKIREIRLHYIGGGSNKFYNIDLIQNPQGTYDVEFVYGRAGTAGNAGTKGDNLPLSKAESVAQSLMNSKTGKGYQVISDTRFSGGSEQTAPAKPVEKAKPVVIEQFFLPMLSNPISESKALELIANPSWTMQLKADGERAVIHIQDGEAYVTNRNGKKVELDYGTRANLLGLISCGVDRAILDCERIGSEFHIFDVIVLDGFHAINKATGFKSRWDKVAELVELLELRPSLMNFIKIIPTAFTTEDKKALLKSVKEKALEGVIFKLNDAEYTSGRPNSGGNSLKYKLVESATVRVHSKSEDKRSITMEILDGNGNWVVCGKCTIPPNHSIPAKGELVECEYLYAMPESNALYQPVYKGKRNDILEQDCVIGQFKFKSEEVTI